MSKKKKKGWKQWAAGKSRGPIIIRPMSRFEREEILRMTDQMKPPAEVQLPDSYNAQQEGLEEEQTAIREQYAKTLAALTPVGYEWENTNAQPRRVRSVYADGRVGAWRIASWAENRDRIVEEARATPVAKESEIEEALDRADAFDIQAAKLLDEAFTPPAQPVTFEQALDVELARLREIMINRQRKYGHRNISRHGQTGVATRFADKAARIDNIYFDEEGNPRSAEEVKAQDALGDESIDDSWIDAANYSVIALMLRHGIWGLPLSERIVE